MCDMKYNTVYQVLQNLNQKSIQGHNVLSGLNKDLLHIVKNNTSMFKVRVPKTQ